MSIVYKALLLLSPCLALAATDRPMARDSRTLASNILLDGNNVACFVSNSGGLAYDLNNERGQPAGFYFPDNWPAQTTTAIYNAGLWLAGTTTLGDTLMSTSEYCTEFVPGAWNSNPEDSQWQVWSITDDPGSWASWPSGQGAPMAANGIDPWIADLPGVSQMMYTVFNDGDAAAHTCSPFSTAPMGVEVRLTAWCSTDPGLETTTFFRWELVNQGTNDFTELHAGIWIDADLGNATDDLGGSDPLRQMGYIYNSNESDGSYGSPPPALGAVLLYGMHEPSPGDSAFYGNEWHAGERNRQLETVTVYNSGLNPVYNGLVWNLLMGLDPNGLPRPGGPLDFSGNPVDGTGALDDTPFDKRMLLSTGPVPFAPGAHQELACSFTAALGSDRLDSITELGQMVPQSLVIPDVPLTALPLHLVNVPAWTVRIDSLGIINTYPSAHDITAADFSLPQFSLVDPLPLTLAASDTTWIRFYFVTPDAAPRTCTIDFTIPAGGSFQALVTANGPWASLTPTGDLGALAGSGAFVDVTLQNVGTQPLDVVGLSGANLWVDPASLPLPSLLPGQSMPVSLGVFSPTPDVDDATLDLAANTVVAQQFDFQWQPGLALDWSFEYVTVDQRPVPLEGIAAGGLLFNGGVFPGQDFFGSTLPGPWLEPGLYGPIRVLFVEDENDYTIAATYDRSLGYSYVTHGLFPGQVWLEDGQGNLVRRLNVCFVEFSNGDGVWYPGPLDVLGDREYLFIMNSEYDGGLAYDNINRGYQSDVLWACWFARRSPSSEILPGDEMHFGSVANALNYNNWVLLNGLAGPAAAFDHDADGDGADNGYEYATGTDPNLAQSIAPLTIAPAWSAVSVVFQRNPLATDVEMRLQRSAVSAYSGPWTDVAVLAGGVWSPPGVVGEYGIGSVLEQSVGENITGTPSAFYRLFVSLPDGPVN